MLRRAAPFLLLALLVLVVAACAGTGTAGSGSPGASGSVAPTATPIPPLEPAKPGTDPISFLAWIFTPIFQAMFIVLCGVYQFLENLGVPAAIGWAIIALTLLVRALVIPLYRRQLVSTKRTQMLQPELKEIQRRYKGDSVKIRQAQQELMKERGVNPLAGCFPILLQMPLLLIMYSVMRTGLTNPDPTAMLTVAGHQIVNLQCTNIVDGVQNMYQPCIDTIIPWFGGIDVSKPSTFASISIGTFVLGLSILAIASAALQRRPQHPDPAADDAVPSAHLGRLRRVPSRRPVHLLDHRDHLLDDPAVPHRGLGCDVPDLRLDTTIRGGPHASIPGAHAAHT